MNNIPVTDLVENTYFDAPVYLDNRYILLSPDTQTTSELIARLRRWGYRAVYSEGNPEKAPSYLSSGEPAISTAVLDAGIKEKEKIDSSKKFYYSLLNFVKELFTRFKEENKLDLAELTEKAKELILNVKRNRDTILRFAEFQYPGENYLFKHGANCAIISLAVGNLLKLPPHRLIELGNAALLHDIGMTKIPENIYLSSNTLTPKERQTIIAHTVIGYRILKGFSASEEIARAALEHHERLDGSGYPRNLKGDKISLYARIIAVACSYDGIITKRPFKDARDGHNALLELIKGRQKLYDDTVIRAFVYCISIFPLGTLVMLSNNAIARVVKTNPKDPKMPIVQIMIDQKGNRITDQTDVKTSEESGITIKRSLGPEEVQNIDLDTAR